MPLPHIIILGAVVTVGTFFGNILTHAAEYGIATYVTKKAMEKMEPTKTTDISESSSQQNEEEKI